MLTGLCNVEGMFVGIDIRFTGSVCSPGSEMSNSSVVPGDVAAVVLDAFEVLVLAVLGRLELDGISRSCELDAIGSAGSPAMLLANSMV